MVLAKNVEEMQRSFFKYVIPAMVATLLGGVYIVVDGFFVGNSLGDVGLAAINIVYPIGTLIMAIAVMVGMGGSVIMSTYLGQGDVENFNKVKANTFFNLIIVSVITTAILFILKNPLIYILGAREEAIFREANSYTTIIVLGGALQIISFGSMPIIRNCGKTIHAMSFMVSGLVSNIILDYLFIMVFNWGMAGAALATIAAQGIVAIFAIYYLFIRKKNRTKISLSCFDLKTSLKALTIGLSPFGLVMSPSLIVIFNNLQCLKYGGEVAVSAYSVVNYLVGSTLLFFEGIAEGCQPMISYFNGAGEHKLMKRVFKKGIIMALTISLSFFFITLILRKNVGFIFGASAEANAIISLALPIIAISFIFQSIVRLGTAYFYSSGKSVYSTLLTYIDPLFVSPLCILTLPIFFGLNGVWLAITAAQFILLILFLSIFFKTNLKDKNIFGKSVYQNS